MEPRLPAPPEAGLLNGLRFGTDTIRFLEGVQARFDDGTAIPIPGRPPLVVLTGPDLVAEALERPEDFPRIPAQGAVSMIAENGLVQSEGELWSQQRSVMAPAFGGKQINAYADTTGTRIESRANRWAETGARDTDLHREMTSLTVRVASEILLGEDIGKARADQFHEWMRVAGEEFEFGIETVLPEWVPTPTSGAFRDAATGIRELSEELIERRRAELDSGERTDASDMLTMLIRAEDNPEVEFPENQIRDEVATFLIAGHETTALSLTYTLALLSWNPDARRRVREEAQAVIGEGPLTHEDLAELEYNSGPTGKRSGCTRRRGPSSDAPTATCPSGSTPSRTGRRSSCRCCRSTATERTSRTPRRSIPIGGSAGIRTPSRPTDRFRAGPTPASDAGSRWRARRSSSRGSSASSTSTFRSRPWMIFG